MFSSQTKKTLCKLVNQGRVSFIRKELSKNRYPQISDIKKIIQKSYPIKNNIKYLH